jgi:hypothetical protein
MAGKILHPKKLDVPVHRLFVASGITVVGDGFDFIVGRLKPADASTPLPGKTLPLRAARAIGVKCWAIYFNVPRSRGKYWTLEVYGITLSADGTTASAQLIDEPKPITMRNESFPVPSISWPNPDDLSGLCISNFIPYGTYTPTGGADTLTAALSGGVGQSASYYYQDPSSGFWTAQFDSFNLPTPPDTHSTLGVSISGVTGSAVQGQIVFADC